MNEGDSVNGETRGRASRLPHRFGELVHRLLFETHQGFARADFLRQAVEILLEFSSCDLLELRIAEEGRSYRCRSLVGVAGAVSWDFSSPPKPECDARPTDNGSILESILKAVLSGDLTVAAPFLTRGGSIWTGDTARPMLLREKGGKALDSQTVLIGGEFLSLALVPIPVDERIKGVMLLGSRRREFFTKSEVKFYEAVGETLGVALAHQRAQWALRERVKELTCLYGIAKATQDPDLPVATVLQEIVQLLPPGWQYPEITAARITMDGVSYSTAGFEDGAWMQSAVVTVNDAERGKVQVMYTKEMPEIDEGPFLKEERHLIDEIARQVGLIIEHKEAEDEKAALLEQLRHADRLATIGQLAAGTAHELNEPLGSVLGFAQLVKNCPSLPSQAERDIEKIINAALHAREIIRKLMIFSRQIPTRKGRCSVNNLVREGLYFLESRCEREGIRVIRELDNDVPDLIADASQLHQVLVNLVVNAIQAMPQGGTLSIRTRVANGRILLTVADTGTGMTQEVMKSLFIPFFTTKDVGQGTGLGLSVVHGIVTAHGGEISVESRPGEGSRFVVSLPVAEDADAKEIS